MPALEDARRTAAVGRPVLINVHIGRTGFRVSPLGFGGAPIGNLDTDLAVVREVLRTLLDHGVKRVKLRTPEGKQDLTGEPLKFLCRRLMEYRGLLKQIERRRDPRVVDALARETEIVRATLAAE